MIVYSQRHHFNNTQLMRKHLTGCLEDKIMRHFIAKKRNTQKMTTRVELLHIYCITLCRMPEGEGQRMICYNTCQECYHDGKMDVWKYMYHQRHGQVITLYETVTIVNNNHINY